MKIWEKITNSVILIFIFSLLSFSNPHVSDLEEQVHIIASDHGFDFLTWTANAVWIKITQNTINAPHYFTPESQHGIVKEDIQVIRDIEKATYDINLVFSDPSVSDPMTATKSLRLHLQSLNNRLNAIAPFTEATLEMQVTTILNDFGLTTGGQPIPWVSYHVTPLPQNLVISRREKIGALTNYILKPLSVDEAASLENNVDKRLNVSSLVVDIGGLAAYPTMIMQTTALDWLTSTIAHEWIHIYLGQRPLGNNYNSPELRTMNETTASIAGTEIGRLVMERYYPELLSKNRENIQLISLPKVNGNPETFDYRSEMHTTRITADHLLAQGKIVEAEDYMEQRRKVFWENGYAIRKLNQAYFAFYGSYADTPGGAAGEDPVGPAVRALRAQSPTLKAFLDRISVMTTFEELQKAVAN